MDLKHCSWAVQVSPHDASRLPVIEKHLQSRVARSGGRVLSAPFSACFVRHDRCAAVVHMSMPVLYQGMVVSVCRWCGSDFLASLSRWDVLVIWLVGCLPRARLGRHAGPLWQAGPRCRQALCGRQALGAGSPLQGCFCAECRF